MMKNKDSQSEDIDNIKQMGVPNMPQQAKKRDTMYNYNRGDRGTLCR